MDNVTKLLRKFGLSDKEVTVYLSLLKLGSSAVSKIAKAAKINRSTSYVILDSLTERGLVSFTEREGKIRTYTAIAADKLAQHFADVAKEYATLATDVKKLVPKIKKEYESKADSDEAPRVRLFEGKTGMKTVYDDALNSLETIRAFASVAEEDDATTSAFYEKLKKKGVKVNLLTPDGAAVKSGAKTFSPEISVYDNKIALVSPSEDFALIIESAELAETLKSAFDRSWKTDKKGRRSIFGKEALGGA